MKLIYSIFLVWSNAGVTLNYSKLYATTFCHLLRCKRGFDWLVIKRATSLFNSFCGSIARFVSHFTVNLGTVQRDTV